MAAVKKDTLKAMMINENNDNIKYTSSKQMFEKIQQHETNNNNKKRKLNNDNNDKGNYNKRLSKKPRNASQLLL